MCSCIHSCVSSRQRSGDPALQFGQKSYRPSLWLIRLYRKGLILPDLRRAIPGILQRVGVAHDLEGILKLIHLAVPIIKQRVVRGECGSLTLFELSLAREQAIGFRLQPGVGSSDHSAGLP